MMTTVRPSTSGRVRTPQAVAVGDERGHNVHQLLPFLEQGVIGRELLCNGVEAVVVCQHDALGRARGAAGVDHHAGAGRGTVGLRQW